MALEYRHDPWFTLKDENLTDVEQDGILLYWCRQDAILPYGYFRGRILVMLEGVRRKVTRYMSTW